MAPCSSHPRVRYAFVSIPIYQFIFLRWYFRLFIWFRFLWQVSRLDFRLIPTHPDRAGGLGILGNTAFMFAPILSAQGAVLSGVMAGRIFFAGQSLQDFTWEIVGLVVVLVVLVHVPLMVFMPPVTCQARGPTGVRRPRQSVRL